jgi:hypothetical protein
MATRMHRRLQSGSPSCLKGVPAVNSIVRFLVFAFVLGRLLDGQAVVDTAAQNGASDPLVRILAAKGLITPEEMRQIFAPDPAEQRLRLARLLHQKGLLTDSELQEIAGVQAAIPVTAGRLVVTNAAHFATSVAEPVARPLPVASEAVARPVPVISVPTAVDPLAAANAALYTPAPVPVVEPVARPVPVASEAVARPIPVISVPTAVDPLAAANAALYTPAPVPVVEPVARPVPVASEAVARPIPVISAIAPLRVLQVDPLTRDGLIPDIKLGSGAKLKLYGMVKASAIYDSSSPSGTDMPLPYQGGDTGPTVDPEFHIRARNMRLGAQFEWLDLSPKVVLTGRFETDFEGSFTRAMNRNISSVRSSQLSLRLGWARVDYNFSKKNSIFLLAGQDWTPFGSSTIPNLFETTGLGLGYGTLYERVPQIRTGWIHTVGGSRNLKFLSEFAVTLPAFGDTPANVADQLGYGERQGSDSGRPEIQGRIVTEWQFDKAPGVVPAQFIVSFVQAGRTALVTAASVPAAFRNAFPAGAEVSSGRYGYTAELQLPTRAFTWTSKYYNGEDLRFYFVGGLYSNFNDVAGLTNQTSAASIDGASTVIFGMRNGVPVIAPQRAVRTQGFMTDVGLPLSRWFNAEPGGRAAGWSANLHYSIDMVPARDARRMTCARDKSDLAAVTLFYKLNSLISFGVEQSMYRTRAANSSANDPGGLFLLRGIPSRQWHDIRTEIGPIFTF